MRNRLRLLFERLVGKSLDISPGRPINLRMEIQSGYAVLYNVVIESVSVNFFETGEVEIKGRVLDWERYKLDEDEVVNV